jgi:hypothetical protein
MSDKRRITVSVSADLAEWLRSKAQWQQRPMSDLAEDALADLREKMGEPGHPKDIDRLPGKALRNLERVRQLHSAPSRDINQRDLRGKSGC